MRQKINVVTLGVKDLSKSVDFYENKLGWKLAEKTDNIVFFDMNGMILSLYPRTALADDVLVNHEGSGFSGFTFAINAESEEEVNNIFRELATKGVVIQKEPRKVFWGGYSGYFADLDGYLWEVAYNPFWKLDQNGNVIIGE